MCMPVRVNGATFVQSSGEIGPNLAQIRIRKGCTKHRRTTQYE